MSSTRITLPYKFKPREYQMEFLRAMDSGCDRAIMVWHRRAGKDKTAWNLLIKKAFERVGIYYYFLPTYKQARKIVWDGIDKTGFKMMGHIPKSVIARKDNQEMKIELVNGSLIQLIGTDNIDSIVGTNPVGCIFSEYSLQDPQAWNFIRPILAENGGWAVFNFTPRGKNHAYDLFQLASEGANKERWYVSRLTVEDTRAIPKYILEEEKEEIIAQHGDDALYQQEYMCSFVGSMQGTYYGKFINDAYKEGRVTKVSYVPGVPVHTFWDLGMSDATAIWFAQIVGNEIHVIDYFEDSGEGLAHYIQVLKTKGYQYGDHYAPHDIKVRELGSGMSRLEMARKLGIRFRITKQISVMDGIQAVRQLMPKMWFDEERCRVGLEALQEYRKEYDDKRREWKSQPYHDWTSHASDAMRYLAVSLGSKSRVRAKKVPSGKKHRMAGRFGRSGSRISGY